jgi:hypothetical protein
MAQVIRCSFYLSATSWFSHGPTWKWIKWQRRVFGPDTSFSPTGLHSASLLFVTALEVYDKVWLPAVIMTNMQVVFVENHFYSSKTKFPCILYKYIEYLYVNVGLYHMCEIPLHFLKCNYHKNWHKFSSSSLVSRGRMSSVVVPVYIIVLPHVWVTMTASVV